MIGMIFQSRAINIDLRVGIQHPGGSWPDNSGKPRSAVIAIWREDGQTIG